MNGRKTMCSNLGAELKSGEKMASGMIFDIKRYSINDGPGIRVTVFFKGCPLGCAWCHNPESVAPGVERMYNRGKCIGCGECVLTCPEQALIMTAEGIAADMKRCAGCGRCAEVCPCLAIEMSGRRVSVDEILRTVEKERIFIDQSGGGVTFSGGEPLHQPRFLTTLLKEAGSRGLHRAVDTTGYAKTRTLVEVAEHTDLFLYDVKMMDTERHKQWTGVGNELILDNLKTLAEIGARINIRLPLIKHVNDDGENIRQTAAFIASLPGGARTINILAYHNIMAGKYDRLGRSFDQGSMAEPATDEIAGIAAVFSGYGIDPVIGG